MRATRALRHWRGVPLGAQVLAGGFGQLVGGGGADQQQDDRVDREDDRAAVHADQCMISLVIRV